MEAANGEAANGEAANGEAANGEAAAARTRCGFVQTLLVLVLAFPPLAAESLGVEIAGKTQTVLLNANVTISCKSPHFPHLDTKISCPVRSLFSEEAKVKDNDSQYLLCKAIGFYPKNINITWCEWKPNSQCLNISVGVTTNAAIANEDNTFNVTTSLQLKRPLEHNVTYRCRVEHIPWCTSWCCDITVHQNGSEPKSEPWKLLLCIGVPCVAVGAVIVAIVLWKRFCSPGAADLRGCFRKIDSKEETPEAFIPDRPELSGAVSDSPSHPLRAISLSFAV